MRATHWLKLLALLAICLPHLCYGQAKTENKADQLRTQFDYALSKAEQIADEALSVEPIAERIKLLVSIADLLWDHNELLARKLLEVISKMVNYGSNPTWR
jgi:acyl-CoA reductase-like NAD-dependent aldehyde dehydrogenase